MSRPPATTIDLSHILDHGPWTGFQMSVLLWAALAVIFDGFDNQLIGFAIPAIVAEWGVARSDFAPVVAIGLAGMTLGTISGGYFGDRFGRKPALIASMVLFGLATLVGALAIGRVGSILSAVAGARLVEAGPPAYFTSIALAMAGTLTGLALVRNHIPPKGRQLWRTR